MMNPPLVLAIAALLALATLSVAIRGQGSRPWVEADVPEGFSRFELAGYPEEAEILSNFLWRHYKSRRPAGSSYGLVLFNQEYQATSDLWLAGAVTGDGTPVQEAMGRTLLAVSIDDEGYVHTHQHFSHAHDRGWPFPLWTQPYGGPLGIAAGWHFQDDVPGWVAGYVNQWPAQAWKGQAAADAWEVSGAESAGVVDGRWRLTADAGNVTLTTPPGVSIDSFNSPFVQLRWSLGDMGAYGTPYLEWIRSSDRDFSSERRVYFDTPETWPVEPNQLMHSMARLDRHPLWEGSIERMRIVLPLRSAAEVGVDSFFTVYDTRHTINNPILILASRLYFGWTGDVGFLRQQINRLRLALRFQQTVMGGLDHSHIVVPWVGHDGRSGLEVGPDGAKTYHPGRGIGNNYWDLLPFGGHDLYATNQYHASLLALAELEEAIREHPEWDVPLGALSQSPSSLRAHAAEVRRVANDLFWDEEKGRFVGWIDMEGRRYDYGFTFVNLDAIWYGLASDEHARSILGWLDGERTIDGDDSVGEDIYHWRFGPRSTTKRNVEAYAFPWQAPESIPWGGQVQDGGAVLGFSFYDMWARNRVLGPDSAWKRLMAITEWERDVWAEGGYRAYYEGGIRGTTLQGGGTAGGLGIDFEFYETSMVPSILIYGLLGIEPQPDRLVIRPRLPQGLGELCVNPLRYHGAAVRIAASDEALEIETLEDPEEPLVFAVPAPHSGSDALTEITISSKGIRRLELR